MTPLAFSGGDQTSVAVVKLESSTVRFTGGESGSNDGMDKTKSQTEQRQENFGRRHKKCFTVNIFTTVLTDAL